MQQNPSFEIAPDVSIPQLGFGLYKVPEDDAARLVSTAASLGYRHFDGAAFYGNERGVGAGLQQVMESGIPREELFVTSKVWNTEQGYEKTLASFEKTHTDLGLDFLDLFLIHWPCPERNLFVETYKALKKLKEEGLVRAIGVSNFRLQDLEVLLNETAVIPAVNQIELHPWLAQKELRAFHEKHGITTEAWSPLARGALLEDPVVLAIAHELNVSAAQVLVRWHLQHGIVVFPKTSSEERMRTNADVFGFELNDDQMSRLDALDCGRRSGSHPDHVN